MVVNTKHAWTNFNGLLNFVAHTDAGRELFKNPNSVYLFTTNKRGREREREEDRQCVCVCGYLVIIITFFWRDSLKALKSNKCEKS